MPFFKSALMKKLKKSPKTVHHEQSQKPIDAVGGDLLPQCQTIQYNILIQSINTKY